MDARRAARSGLASVLLAAAVTGCGEQRIPAPDGAATGPATTVGTTSATPGPTPGPASPASPASPAASWVCRWDDQPRPDRVLVFRTDQRCGDLHTADGISAQPHAVAPAADLETRLRTSATESLRDGDRLLGVDVDGDRAVIDLDLTGEASTSAHTTATRRLLEAIAFQFAEVDELEPRWAGSCELFTGWTGSDGCRIARRGRVDLVLR